MPSVSLLGQLDGVQVWGLVLTKTPDVENIDGLFLDNEKSSVRVSASSGEHHLLDKPIVVVFVLWCGPVDGRVVSGRQTPWNVQLPFDRKS